MGLSQAIYNGIFKRTSTFVVAIAFASFGFERCKYSLLQSFAKKYVLICKIFRLILVIDSGIDYVWETHNKGKLWKDIKHKYGNVAEEEE